MRQSLESLDKQTDTSLPLISVIIPVYNGERYIDKAVNSIINQPCFKYMEIVLVNDGSSDNSEEICKKYTGAHKNIKLINKINGGVSSARNKGIDYATGKYIAFLDCDDWWNDDFFDEDILGTLINDAIDIYGFSYCDTNGNCKYFRVHHVQERTEYYNDRKTGRYNNYHHCSFLFSRELLMDNQNIRYPNVMIVEDGSFCGRCFYLAKSYKTIDKQMFTYWSNSDSITHTVIPEKFFTEVYKGFLSNREWFNQYGQKFDVEKCVCVLFYNYIKMLCCEYKYQKVKQLVDEDDRLKPIYKYREMNLQPIYYKTIEKWNNNSRMFYLKYMIKYKFLYIIRKYILNQRGPVRNVSEFIIYRLLKKYEKNKSS